MKNFEVYPMFFGFHIQKNENNYIVIFQNNIFEKPRRFSVTLEGLRLMAERLNAVIEMEEKEKEGGER